MNTTRSDNALAFALICCSALASGSANASTYGFIDITNNTKDISAQLKLNVSEVNNQALFTISNLSPGISSSVAAVYFDQGSNNFFADTTTDYVTTKTTTTGTYSCTSNCGSSIKLTTSTATNSTTSSSGKTGSTTTSAYQDSAAKTTVTKKIVQGKSVYTTTTYSGTCTSGNCTDLTSSSWKWTQNAGTPTTSPTGTVGTSYANVKLSQTTTTTSTSQGYISGIVFDGAASSSGVHFADGGNSVLPGGKTVSFSADDWSYAVQPAPDNGVNPGEWVGFLGTFVDGNYAGLLKAIESGSFRVGLHVISIAGGNSDSYVSTVPLPAAAWLFGSALLGFAGWSRRSKV